MNAFTSLVDHPLGPKMMTIISLPIFFQDTSISAVGGTQVTELFPRSKALTQESEVTTRDEEMPSTNASRLLDKGKWSLTFHWALSLSHA